MSDQDLHLSAQTGLFTKQLQRIMMTHEMQTALHLLQLPLLELSTCIEEAVEENPFLEYEDEAQIEKTIRKLEHAYQDQFLTKEHYSKEDALVRQFQEESSQGTPSLYEHLLSQAHDSFDKRNELQIAEEIIGLLDERGYLTTSLQDIAPQFSTQIQDIENILKQIQTFEPFGVGARSLQETFLIQLTCLNKTQSLAYTIVQNHFEDLLHGRIASIKQALKSPEEDFQKALFSDIAKLDIHPGLQITKTPPLIIIPDILIVEENNTLQVKVNKEYIPKLRFNPHYLNMLKEKDLPKETKSYLLNKLSAGKFFIKGLDERNSTLHKIGSYLLKEQHAFFVDPRGALKPLTMQTVAKSLQVNESTITRAISNKYLTSPRGTFSLRSFFNYKYHTDGGDEVSSDSIKKLLVDLIRKEDKKHPASDQTLAQELQKLGIPCARRTVTKYRELLNIASSKIRRNSSIDI